VDFSGYFYIEISNQMSSDNNYLNDIQISALKALLKRNRPAPYCNSFLFINQVIIRSEVVKDLVERGLIMQVHFDPQIEAYDLTSDGLKLAEKLN
jgi:hypothetical protein